MRFLFSYPNIAVAAISASACAAVPRRPAANPANKLFRDQPLLSTSVISVQILQLVDNAYNRCNCAQASDCDPGIQQFGTRPKSHQAANCALNMSAFSVQKRSLSAIDSQSRGMCSRIRAILHRRFRLKPPSRRRSTVESRQRYQPALVRPCMSRQKLLKYWTHTSDVDSGRHPYSCFTDEDVRAAEVVDVCGFTLKLSPIFLEYVIVSRREQGSPVADLSALNESQ